MKQGIAWYARMRRQRMPARAYYGPRSFPAIALKRQARHRSLVPRGMGPVCRDKALFWVCKVNVPYRLICTGEDAVESGSRKQNQSTRGQGYISIRSTLEQYQRRYCAWSAADDSRDYNVEIFLSSGHKKPRASCLEVGEIWLQERNGVPQLRPQ